MSIDRVSACCLCGAPKPEGFEAYIRAGWNWWTGFNLETEAACPGCQRTNPAEVERRIAASQIPLEKRAPE